MIQKIKLTNFKCIENLEAEFSGGVYLITGENEIGKSTLLEAIIVMLTGKRGETLLQKGKANGSAEMAYEHTDGNVYIIEVKFSLADPRGTFTISTKGSPMKTNKVTALQTIFGYNDFDVNEFIKWSETAEGRRKQLQLARKLLPAELIVAVDALEIEIADLTKKKSDANINRNFATTRLKAMPSFSPADIEKYSTETDITALLDEINKKAEYNRKYGNAVDTVESYKRQIAELQKQIDLLELNKKELELKFEKNPQPYDIRELNSKLSDAGEHNEKVRQIKVVTQAENELLEAEKIYSDIESKLYQKTYERTELIKANPLPIPELDFDSDGLIYMGMPVQPNTLSTSQEIELAARLIMALNPTTKVFRIAHGESLGTKRLESLAEFAISNGYQGFIENVVRNQDEMKIEEYTENERTAAKTQENDIPARPKRAPKG